MLVRQFGDVVADILDPLVGRDEEEDQAEDEDVGGEEGEPDDGERDARTNEHGLCRVAREVDVLAGGRNGMFDIAHW